MATLEESVSPRVGISRPRHYPKPAMLRADHDNWLRLVFWASLAQPTIALAAGGEEGRALVRLVRSRR